MAGENTGKKIELKDLSSEALEAIKGQLKEQVSAEFTSEKISEITAKVMAELKQTPSDASRTVQPTVTENNKNTPLPSNEIPDEDLMAEPKVFYMWKNAYVDFGYKHKGQEVKPPYDRPILFTTMPPQVSVDTQGKRHELRWSAVKVWSKQIYAYIKKHPFFIAHIILEQEGDLQQQDTRNLTVRMKAVQEVMAMNKNQLIGMCQGRNIASDNDMSKMQEALIDSITKEALGNQNAAIKDIAERTNKELLKGGLK